MARVLVCIGLLQALSALTLPALAQAQSNVATVDVTADVYQGQFPSTATAADDDIVSGRPAVAHATAREDEAGEHAVARGRATASPGRIAAGMAVRTDGNEGADTLAQVRGAFSDELTLSHADLTGRTGEVTIAYRYWASLTAEAPVGDTGRGAAIFKASLNDMAFGEDDTRLNDWGDVTERWPFTGTPGDAGVLLLTTTFVWGSAFSTYFEATALGWATALDGTGPSFATVTAQGAWDGIRSVTVGGVAVDGWSVQSLSGTDYSRPFDVSAPVPEPATAALLALGLAGVAREVRRRRRSGAASA